MKDVWENKLEVGDVVYYLSREAPFYFNKDKITSFVENPEGTKARIGGKQYSTGAIIKAGTEKANIHVVNHNLQVTYQLVEDQKATA